jgi:DNA-binding transcriptional ArsR family regulator
MHNRPETIDQRLVHALAHPLRVQILEVLSEKVASPHLLSMDLEVGLSHVAYHTRALDRCGCLELIRTAQRRGATEHFYKACPHAFVGDRRWRKVPRAVRGGVSGAWLQSFMDKAVAALEAGTIDGRENTVLNWMPVRVDEQGWEKIAAIMEEATDRVLEVETASRRRLERVTNADGTLSAVVALANFETGGSRGAR